MDAQPTQGLALGGDEIAPLGLWRRPEWRGFKTKREISATEFQRLTKSDLVKTALRQRHSHLRLKTLKLTALGGQECPPSIAHEKLRAASGRAESIVAASKNSGTPDCDTLKT